MILEIATPRLVMTLKFLKSGRHIGRPLRLVDQPVGADTRVRPFPDEIYTDDLAEASIIGLMGPCRHVIMRSP